MKQRGLDHRKVDAQTQQDWYGSSSILGDDTVDADIGVHHLCDLKVYTQAHNVDSLYQQLQHCAKPRVLRQDLCAIRSVKSCFIAKMLDNARVIIPALAALCTP